MGVVHGSLADDALTDPLPGNGSVDHVEERPIARKSKRQKTVPSGLVETYECGPHILTRFRDARKCVFVLEDMTEMDRKYHKLLLDVNNKV